MPQNKNKNQIESEKINIKQLLFSVLAAFFGVQNDKTRERDFARGKPLHYIMMGLIVVFVLILILYSLVQIVMHFLVK